MHLTHVHAFTAAMARKDLAAMLSRMAEDVVLATPLASAPVRGKPAVRDLVGALLATVDRFDFQEIMEGPRHVSSFFTVRIGSTDLDGMDYWRLDDAGLIVEMTVLWRPLPAILAAVDAMNAAPSASASR